jgi:hypothetical protein
VLATVLVRLHERRDCRKIDCGSRREHGILEVHNVNLRFARYRFSATLITDDAAVLHCLIGLSHWAQRGEKYPQIAWRGCGEKDWRSQGGRVTFRFTSPERRTEWHAKATELLSGKWALISTSDNDPASPSN